MFANHYEEHLASQPDNSRFDGFDRGTVWADEDTTPVERVIGRMTSESGHRVVVKEVQFDEGDAEHSVYINGRRVFCDLDCRAQAIQVARWWMAGCPA
jgi:hypothetical protein